MQRVKKIGERLIYWGLYLPIIILTGAFVFPIVHRCAIAGPGVDGPCGIVNSRRPQSGSGWRGDARRCVERSRNAEARVKRMTTDQYGMTVSVLR